jgi:hypothetical protein
VADSFYDLSSQTKRFLIQKWLIKYFFIFF